MKEFMSSNGLKLEDLTIIEEQLLEDEEDLIVKIDKRINQKVMKWIGQHIFDLKSKFRNDVDITGERID